MKVHSTNYINTFIEVAEDCPAVVGELPPTKGDAKSIANIQFELISKHPYQFTSDDVLVEVFARRNDLTVDEYEQARKELFSKGQPCLRSSPLAKRYGWGIHHNAEGKVALFGSETEEYKQMVNDGGLKKVKAMRSKKS